jgi:hypothetical protein
MLAGRVWTARADWPSITAVPSCMCRASDTCTCPFLWLQAKICCASFAHATRLVRWSHPCFYYRWSCLCFAGSLPRFAIIRKCLPYGMTTEWFFHIYDIMKNENSKNVIIIICNIRWLLLSILKLRSIPLSTLHHRHVIARPAAIDEQTSCPARHGPNRHVTTRPTGRPGRACTVLRAWPEAQARADRAVPAQKAQTQKWIGPARSPVIEKS